jgi:hypothetical protein
MPDGFKREFETVAQEFSAATGEFSGVTAWLV